MKMILLIAVVFGLIAGLIRARVGKHAYMSFSLKGFWLVFLAYLPQFFAFNLSATRAIMPDSWIPPILISSQLLLLIFVWVNRVQSGFLLLGLGLLFNFLVISLNGGMMPISPEIANQLIEPGSIVNLQIGHRVGTGKDILLQSEDTKLSVLSDRFTLPNWIPYRLAYSFGDILISIGAFWLLWQLGGP
jgi:hypothetical protein